jgi:CheY-like chemotaxis protein
MAGVIGIVKGHHGAIMVESEPGKGTTIRVLFPVPKKVQGPSVQGEEVVETKKPVSSTVGRRKTILVVEDEGLVRAMILDRLDVLGYDTIAASDGEEGVRVFLEHSNEIDLVLLDFVMPRMNGVEAFEELIRIRPDLKVILSSGYTEDVVIRRFPGPKPAGFLNKPYKIEVMKAELDRLLGADG